MDAPHPTARDLAQRLLAATLTAPVQDQRPRPVELVIERLRLSLTRLAGAEAFASLLRRAVAMAAAHEPSLRGIKVEADGHLTGLDRLATATGTATGPRGDGGDGPVVTGQEARGGVDPSADAAVAIAAHLLELLITFIGEPLTLTLLREGLPEALPDESNPTTEPTTEAEQ